MVEVSTTPWHLKFRATMTEAGADSGPVAGGAAVGAAALATMNQAGWQGIAPQ